jgi:hypothetical protein
MSLLLVIGSLAKTGLIPAAVTPGFRASIVGADVVVEGSGKLRVVELPRNALLYGPGGDMNDPQPNPGAPSTPRGALIGGAVEAGPGCQAVPQVKGVEGFHVLCPFKAGGSVRVNLGSGNDRLDVNGGGHGRYYNDVYDFLGVPLQVQGGAGDDRIDTQTVQQVRVDAGPGNDRISLGLSGPNNTLIGGPGDDTFAYGVYVSDYAYDGNPAPRTRRIDLDCGPGADVIEPYPRFRHGPGCPARPPRLIALPLTLRGTCRDRCRWTGPRRLVVTVRNPTAHRVTLGSARLAIERWESEPGDRRVLTLARRKRLSLPARGSARIAMPARRRRALDRQLDEYILSFGVVPSLDLTGALVERDGDRTAGHVTVRIREKPIEGFKPLD